MSAVEATTLIRDINRIIVKMLILNALESAQRRLR